MFHADIGSRLPVTMVYGNHERQQVGTGTNAAFTTNDSGGEAGIPMAVRFPITPSYNGNNAQSVAATGYYAIREGPATFIYLNSELAMDPSSAQYQWADSWLSNQFDRTVTPWLFFVWHRPIYISNNIFYTIEAIEPLLLKWMVDCVFNGHQHYAMHTAGVYNGTVLTANTSPSIQSDGWIGTLRSEPLPDSGQ
jgi:Calcineurin-like phosphoesterase